MNKNINKKTETKTKEKQRVQKLLSNWGYCSRRQAEELIKQGRVTVNGLPITIGDCAGPHDKINVDANPVKQDKKVYYLFYKPLKCVTAVTDKCYKTVMDYVDVPERVFPVGRLDYNTSGLLILTNDGDYANRIIHPRYETKKTYFVEIEDAITKREIQQIRDGIVLSDGKTAPAFVKRYSAHRIEITIHEGKNRIIRRMFGFLGHKIKKLERIKIGRLQIGKLKPGQYKVMTPEEQQLPFYIRSKK